jgi:hypothetical protein
MKAIITQIESVVTPSGNSGHVVVPKAWKRGYCCPKGKEKESKGRKVSDIKIPGLVRNETDHK